ncbi:hypothetical protein [Streptomyces dysideae]|uniref:Uncharacterized protein n=1 Tax=Streptomyces dysideae TaxID=909626 RepID=A0A101UQF7_9ACTN|nr:hypothetical protein [Streptomyces dysideae]KUO14995.1 hypothetical protein AQJ91_43860 [Streptomyces dysideae]
MITAWSPSGARRSRSTAALWRVLGLGLFLFGLLYTHAVSPEATVSHLGTDRVSVSTVHVESVAEDLTDHSDGHGHQHAGEDCALGQPSQGPDMAAPCLSPLHPVSDENEPLRPVAVRHAAPRDLVAPPAHAAASAVLRV